MTPEEIKAVTTARRDDTWLREGRIMLPLAGIEVLLEVLCDDNDDVTPHMASELTALLGANPDRWPEIETILIKDAQSACEEVDLGFPAVDGEDLTLTNRREIGLGPDGSAPAGWAKPSWIKRVQLVAGDVYRPAYAEIGFDVDWEQEHGCHIRLEDGQFTYFNP